MMNKAAVEMRAWRVAHGHGQAVFAKMVGTSQCMLAYMESGRRTPGKYLAKQIASVCGVAADAWSVGVEAPSPADVRRAHAQERADALEAKRAARAKSAAPDPLGPHGLEVDAPSEPVNDDADLLADALSSMGVEP